MPRTYSQSASGDVECEMRKFKKDTLKSGKDSKGGTVKSRKRAIAIGLSGARKEDKKVQTRRAGSLAQLHVVRLLGEKQHVKKQNNK